MLKVKVKWKILSQENSLFECVKAVRSGEDIVDQVSQIWLLSHPGAIRATNFIGPIGF
jgi:hypothetical protein